MYLFRSILVGRTFELLHDAGISLGDMRWRDAFRHAIVDIDAPGLSREDLLNGKAPCYLVGFSEAEAAHSCMRRVPILPLGSYLSPEKVGCEEIAAVSLLINFMEKANTRYGTPSCLSPSFVAPNKVRRCIGGQGSRVAYHILQPLSRPG
ncbi:hypothetical protein DFH06DRAFT_102499 [Mycena polygramma]|nr:hypothetical protein DFH06DRAFT_102499 [Mycena polygramma]